MPSGPSSGLRASCRSIRRAARAQSRRPRPQLVGPDIRRHAVTAAGIRDRGRGDRPRCRLPLHAARSGRDDRHAVPLRELLAERQLRSRWPGAGSRPGRLPLPQGLVPRQPRHPNGECPAVGHLGFEHGDHRACPQGVPPHAKRQPRRLAHPDQGSPRSLPDLQRPPARGAYRHEHRDQEQPAVVVGDHQLGDRVRYGARARHSRHGRRPAPQRDSGRPAHPGRNRCERFDSSRPDGRHRRRPRPGRRRPRYGGGLRRGDRVHPLELPQRGHRRARKRSRREPRHHSRRHPICRGGRRLAVRGHEPWP